MKNLLKTGDRCITQLANTRIDPKTVELTADVVRIILKKIVPMWYKNSERCFYSVALERRKRPLSYQEPQLHNLKRFVKKDVMHEWQQIMPWYKGSK